MPIEAEPGYRPEDHARDHDPEEQPVRQAPYRPSRPQATGSGRTVPTPKAPVEQSGSAKRNQPSRQPRSKRGK